MRALLLLISLAACRHLDVDLSGRPCEAGGVCSEGYTCHPETKRCAPEIYVSCEDIAGICPDTITEATPCWQPGAFISCDSNYPPCERGCRTCGENGLWGPCSQAASCELGRPESCSSCQHDCRLVIENAFAICVGGACSYAGSCAPGSADTDGLTSNGCECEESAGGIELCDGIDNDCNGVTDDADGDCSGELPRCSGGLCVCDAASCGAGRWCDGSGCRDCADDDPLHCGVACELCPGGQPTCAGGACTCAGASCGWGSYCDPNGACQLCGDDPLHCGPDCGVCGGEQPLCVGGACSCTDTSCPMGEWCTSAGSCAPCDDTLHCGPSCGACPVGSTSCNAPSGACSCSAGSCPPGEYCTAAGSCAACSCPGLFPACVDTGGAFVCRCTAASCTQGGTCDTNGTRCRWLDDLDAGTTTSVCTGSGYFFSSWERGAASGFTGCRGGLCWASSLAGNYNACEASCVRSASLPLAGVTGSADVRFWAAYDFETNFDGATVIFQQAGGTGTFVAPEGGWDTAQLDVGSLCTWSAPTWPGFGQYGGGAARPWEQKRFHIDSSTRPTLFHDDFFFRIFVLSDGNTQETGIYVDDIEITVTQFP